MFKNSRGYIPNFRYMDVLVASGVVQTQGTNIRGGHLAQGPSVWLAPDMIAGFSIQTRWNQLSADTQTLTGTIVVEASDDELANPQTGNEANALWADITSQLTITNPTTGAGNDLIMVSDVRFDYVRLRLGSPGDSGRFIADFAGRG